MSAYQNDILLVDTTAIGIRSRYGKQEGDYYLHPLVRDSWGTADKFRGVQGYYFAKNLNSKYPYMVNFSKFVGSLPRALNMVLGGRFTNSSFTVTADAQGWARANRGSGEARKKLYSYLLKPKTGATSGDPNFYQYMAGNIGKTSYYQQYYKNLNGNQVEISPIVNVGPEYTDHTTLYRSPPKSRAALGKSNYNVAVNSFYNFYLDTMPPYESVVSKAGRGVELLLPNLYMLESDIVNTASVNYTDQLTLNQIGTEEDGPQMDVWFLDQTQASPESGKAYFQQFSKILDTVTLNGALKGIKDTFESRFKNIAILYPDLDILKKYNVRDDRGTPNDTSDDIKSTAFYPFYNEVIIGFDRDDVLGVDASPGAQSFFTSLFASKLDADHVRSFIVFLQLYIMENMRTGDDVFDTGYESFARKAVDASGHRVREIASMAGKGEVVCDIDYFLEALKNRELDYLLDVYNESKEEMAEGSNYTVLREWEKEELFKINIKDAIKVANSRELEDALDDRLRSLKEVFQNKPSPGETLMYLIEKREVIPGRETPSPIIQTIVVSKDVVYGDLIRYLDTQVRYGVRYSYEVKQVRMIFGNSYSYDGISFDFGAKKIGQGKAVGNALGFYSDQAVGTLATTVNGLDASQEYEYLKPGTEQLPASVQQGHFIFKLPTASSNALVADRKVPATRGSAKNSSLGRYYQAVRTKNIDLSGLTVELHAGYGTNGAADGGMTAYAITIPETETNASGISTQTVDDVDPDKQDPAALYRQAINIMTGDTAGNQGDLDSTINEIVTKLRRLLEEGNQSSVNGSLAQLRRSRDILTPIAQGSGQSSVGATDSRSLAARQIYNTIDNRVRELMEVVVPFAPERKNTDLTNPLLKEILGPSNRAERSSTATTFTGGKGNPGNKMQFGK